MGNRSGHVQVCPTRIDGASALFAHRVTAQQCQDRQRGRYHKCFTCLFNNAYVAKHGMPGTASHAEPEVEVEVEQAIELPAEPVLEESLSTDEESPTEASATHAKVAS